MVTMDRLLKLMVQKSASDLHLTSGAPPQLRIDGTLVKADEEILTAKRTKELTYSILSQDVTSPKAVRDLYCRLLTAARFDHGDMGGAKRAFIRRVGYGLGAVAAEQGCAKVYFLCGAVN